MLRNLSSQSMTNSSKNAIFVHFCSFIFVTAFQAQGPAFPGEFRQREDPPSALERRINGTEVQPGKHKSIKKDTRILRFRY